MNLLKQNKYYMPLSDTHTLCTLTQIFGQDIYRCGQYVKIRDHRIQKVDRKVNSLYVWHRLHVI